MNAWAVLASRMVDQGVVVVIAAGNAGEDGPFSASNGASGEHVVGTCLHSFNLFVFVPYLGLWKIGSDALRRTTLQELIQIIADQGFYS